MSSRRMLSQFRSCSRKDQGCSQSSKMTMIESLSESIHGFGESRLLWSAGEVDAAAVVFEEERVAEASAAIAAAVSCSVELKFGSGKANGSSDV